MPSFIALGSEILNEQSMSERHKKAQIPEYTLAPSSGAVFASSDKPHSRSSELLIDSLCSHKDVYSAANDS